MRIGWDARPRRACVNGARWRRLTGRLRCARVAWYTAPLMARCPLCSERPAKRFCPAKEATICGFCCGTKREVEIDCPGVCPYLRAGRAYENDHRVPDPELTMRMRGLEKAFPYQHRDILTSLTLAIAEERQQSPWLMDSDVIE